MNSRIKEVRKAKGLSQAAFGAPFGANRDMINNVENGRAAVSDIMVASICRTYDVNERWLRTGEGEMFIQISRDQEIMDFVADTMQDDDGIISAFVAKAINRGDCAQKRVLRTMADLPDEMWPVVETFVAQVADAAKKEGNG